MSEPTATLPALGETPLDDDRLLAVARRFGTPVYVYDGDALSSRFRRLRERLHPAMDVFFSLKANPNVSVCATLHGAGACAEVSSMTELLTALRAGVPPRDIVFLGPGKSAGELSACLEHGIYAVICESFGELELLDRLAGEAATVAPVVLRVNPEFSVKGSGLTMGGKARQFGIDEQQLLDSQPPARRYRHLRVFGVQAYLGTRILDERVVVDNSRRVLDLAERICAHLEIPLEFVDVGGGLGVAYFEGETDPDEAALCEALNPLVDDFARRHPGTRIAMELGRYLTATSGVYLAGVTVTKTSFGQHFAVLDGGTNHHMAAVGIGSVVHRNFPLRVVGAQAGPDDGEWTLTGPLCTPNDTIGKKVRLPSLRRGDVVAVTRSGAYGPSASPVNFLSHGHPAEVLLRQGQEYLVREPDGAAELMARQRLVPPVPPVAPAPEHPAGAPADDPRPHPAAATVATTRGTP